MTSDSSFSLRGCYERRSQEGDVMTPSRTVSASAALAVGAAVALAAPAVASAAPQNDSADRAPVLGTSSDTAIPDSYVVVRSEEHTSELQSRGHLVCRLLHEK